MYTIRHTLVALSILLSGALATITTLAFASTPTVPAVTTERTSAETQRTEKPLKIEGSVTDHTETPVEQPVAQQTASQTVPPQPHTPAPAPQAPPASQGNRLVIPSIRLNAAITPIGLTATGAVDVPAHDVGLWTGSVTPGAAYGATFLDGHYVGIFARLHQVQVGHTFSITYSGQTYSYRVVYTETVHVDHIDMRKAISVYGGMGHGVNIMTCAGQFVSSINTYDHRFIVYALAV